MEEVYITGLGALSCIGNNVAEHVKSLRINKSGISRGNTDYCRNLLVGEVSMSNEHLIDKYALHDFASRTALLGTVAAREALWTGATDDNDYSVLQREYAQHEQFWKSTLRSGVIVGTSVGGMDISEKEYRSFLRQKRHTTTNYRYHPSGKIAEYIAQKLYIDGFINTISTACSSAANAIMIGARMIGAGMLDRVIAGGTDALTEFTVRGFLSLGVYDNEWCRPFDGHRKGLNLGEAAGFIVMENAKSVALRKSTVVALISGWGNASDAYHQTASSPRGQGAKIAMQKALKTAQLSPADIQYINAHGTATINNDLSESNAMIDVFHNKVPSFSSTKSYTGHTLGAAGGLEAVLSIGVLQTQRMPINLNYAQPIEETALIPTTEQQPKEKIQHVLSNSFGFGGNSTSLIFSSLNTKQQ